MSCVGSAAPRRRDTCSRPRYRLRRSRPSSRATQSSSERWPNAHPGLPARSLGNPDGTERHRPKPPVARLNDPLGEYRYAVSSMCEVQVEYISA